MVRLVHTSDLQIGMPFHRMPGDPGARLRELRLEVITRLDELLRAEEADFLLVAGDLFDANTLEERVVIQACDRLREIEIPVYVMPGNHDHCSGPGSIYRRDVFLSHGPQNLVVLEIREPLEPLELEGLGTLLLPAPLFHRSVECDPTEHLTGEFGREISPDAIRVGLAHGSVVDFASGSTSGSPSPGAAAGPPGGGTIDPRRATRADLDYLALGDWHALVVEIGENGALPEVRPVHIARTRWLRHAVEVTGPDDVERLERWFAELEAPRDLLLRLELEGSLALALLHRLDLKGPQVLRGAGPC
jgi:DNA repair exonuclease SbcCD nuclease subunit